MFGEFVSPPGPDIAGTSAYSIVARVDSSVSCANMVSELCNPRGLVDWL